MINSLIQREEKGLVALKACLIYLQFSSLCQLSKLQLESENKEKDLEKEKNEIVEAAKEFAIQREKQFTEQIESLQQKLYQKEESIQSLETELNQLRYNLKVTFWLFSQDTISLIFVFPFLSAVA